MKKLLFWLNAGAALINVTLSLLFAMPLLFLVGGLSALTACLLWRYQ